MGHCASGWREAHREIRFVRNSASGTTGTAYVVLLGVSFSHLLNDIIQSLLPAIYPLLKSASRLDFGQVGLITFTFQLTASIMQPLVGFYTDQRPSPFSLPIGMTFSLVGLVFPRLNRKLPCPALGRRSCGLGFWRLPPRSLSRCAGRRRVVTMGLHNRFSR